MGGGNWLTQSRPTNFHRFYKRKMLAPGETIEDFMEVTDAEKAALEASDKAWEKPPLELIGWWDSTAAPHGRYNEATGFFELNGLTDIKTGEAMKIYAYRIRNEQAMPLSCKNVQGLRTAMATFKPIYGENWTVSEMFRSCKDLEVARLGHNDAQGIGIAKMDFAFYQCGSLREIRPFIKETGSGTRGTAYGSFYYMAFFGCAALEEVRLHSLKSDISLADSPRLSFDSLSYMVANAANTSAITITVHPEVYSKLTGDTTNGAASALSEDELARWTALVALAAAKNIQFATT